MTKKERYQYILGYFQEHAPAPETELHYRSPYELLVAVILSAQCTDKRVNEVTPKLFETFPNAEYLSHATFDEVFPLIRSISYPNNKAKHLIRMAKMLMEDFNNVIPSDINEMQKLPGVGRKTANVIASVVYDQPTMAVDTHVNRVSKRLGLVSQKATTPLAVEKELVKHIPKALIPKAHHWIILHGRYICLARKPKCDSCPLTHWCAYFEKNNR